MEIKCKKAITLNYKKESSPIARMRETKHSRKQAKNARKKQESCSVFGTEQIYITHGKNTTNHTLPADYNQR